MNNPEHCTYYPLFYYRRCILPKQWLNQPIRWCYRLLQNQLLVLLKKSLCLINLIYVLVEALFIVHTSPCFKGLTDIDIVVLHLAIVF